MNCCAPDEGRAFRPMSKPFPIAAASPQSPAQRSARYGVLDLVQQPVWIFDIDRRRVYWGNTASLAVWNAVDLDELCARDMGRDMSESVARRLAQYQSDFIEHGATFNEQWTIYPGGTPVSMHVNYSGHRLPDGRMAMLCQGQPTQADTPESLRSVEALLHTAVMITLYDLDGRPLYRNPAARESVRALDESLQARIEGRAGFERLMATLATEEHATFTLAVHTTHGQRWHEFSARRCRDAVTGNHAWLVSEVDVSALKHTEAHASFLALHDSLTGLPNRAHVTQRFVEAVKGLQQSGREAALIFIDLDHFKNVNDTLGHGAGDELLVQVAKRLSGAARSTDLVARLGGDEFLILVAAEDIRHEVDRIGARIINTVSQPLAIAGTEVRVTPSMGVSLYPRDGTDFETLLRHADLAMYIAKDRGRNDVAYFEEGMGVAVRARTALEADLRRAVERGEFEVHYQPRVCVASGHITGAEALVRWRHPERGLVRPDAFIPVCESTGLIRQIGMWVFQQAVRQQVAWEARGHRLQVSVNLSPRQFSDPELLAGMRAALLGAGCDAGQIEIEITESMLLGTDERAGNILRGIRSLGMPIALDDFGTGYSNLAYLQRYPIHTLKIDKTFIQSIDVDRPLAELIVAMCRLMRLSVVAEGVETPEQLDWITRHGIEHYQGYLFARPMPAAEFDALLGVAAAAG
jgi:diguanylate cyclase (GGDEF)-like protein